MVDDLTKEQIAKVLFLKGTDEQKKEALTYCGIATPTYTESSSKKWFLSDSSLEDGWYWRKCSNTDPDPECVKVCNGVMIDAEPIDSYGADWRLFENYDFQDYWFSGPIEIPK